MSSRFVPITVAIFSFGLVVFFIWYFNSVWHWLVSSPILVLVTWPALKIGLFAPQTEVDKMTGADKLELAPIKPFLLAIELISFSRYIFYGLAAYIGFTVFSFYAVLPLAAIVCVLKSFNSVRFNLTRDSKRRNGILGVAKIYPFFYVQDLIIVSAVYGLGYFIGMLFR